MMIKLSVAMVMASAGLVAACAHGVVDDGSEPEPAEPSSEPPEQPGDPLAEGEEGAEADDSTIPDEFNWNTPPQGDYTSVTEVCYPGADSSYTACLPVVNWAPSFGAAYDYPSHEGAAYVVPSRYVDLSQADSNLMVAANFSLVELMQPWKGQFGVFQSHLVEKLQQIRDLTGPLQVNSGYRNVHHNGSVGGATFSRHLYGDAVDLKSLVVSLNELAQLCDTYGADYVGMYSSHVHCDWRHTPKDPAFYGPIEMADAVGGPSVAATEPRVALPSHEGQIVHQDGLFFAEASGFEEGEPYCRWTAEDDDGQVVDHAVGCRYEPPAAAARVTAEVGGQLMLSAVVPAI
jgi:hypothetical protein